MNAQHEQTLSCVSRHTHIHALLYAHTHVFDHVRAQINTATHALTHKCNGTRLLRAK